MNLLSFSTWLAVRDITVPGLTPQESAALLLLAASLLVFRAFRERYLLIWTLGWLAYFVSRWTLADHARRTRPQVSDCDLASRVRPGGLPLRRRHLRLYPCPRTLAAPDADHADGHGLCRGPHLALAGIGSPARGPGSCLPDRRHYRCLSASFAIAGRAGKWVPGCSVSACCCSISTGPPSLRACPSDSTSW